MNENRDIIIVGGGAAGLSAALNAGRACRSTLVIDAGEPRNRFAHQMHGMLGHDGRDPADLLRLGRAELARYDVEIRPGHVTRVESDGGDTVRLDLADGSTLTTRALVVATGLSDDLPHVRGLAEHWGTDVLHCPYCHGWEVRGQRLGVLATSAASLHQVELVRQWSEQVTFFSAACGDLDPTVTARLRARGITILTQPVTQVLSDEAGLRGVGLADGTEVAVDAVFTAATLRPLDGFLAGLELDRTETPMGSFLTVDATSRTSHRRIWAAGNVVNPGANVPVAAGAGSLAGAMANMALVAEEFDLAATSAAD